MTLSALALIVWTAISVKVSYCNDCNVDSGPAGVTGCVYIPRYNGYQWGMCLTNDYIQRKSKYKHLCQDRLATYCWYQCEIELFDKNVGPISPRCACDPNNPSTTPSPTAIPKPTLPPWCYSPPGDSCNWYRDCLEKRFPCVEDKTANYAMEFGFYFCKQYEATYHQFTDLGQKWIDSVRKCLQLALVPELHDYNSMTTCSTIQEAALDSHECCYLGGSDCTPAGSPSICDLPVSDWCRSTVTVAESLLNVRVMTEAIQVAGKCAGFDLNKKFVEGTVRLTGQALINIAVLRTIKLAKWVLRTLRDSVKRRPVRKNVDESKWRSWLSEINPVGFIKETIGKYVSIEFIIHVCDVFKFFDTPVANSPVAQGSPAESEEESYLTIFKEEMEMALQGDDFDFRVLVDNIEFTIENASICNTVGSCAAPNKITVKQHKDKWSECSVTCGGEGIHWNEKNETKACYNPTNCTVCNCGEGTCNITGGCDCNVGYVAQNNTCVPDVCTTPNLCVKHATCIIVSGKEFCICDPGYVGDGVATPDGTGCTHKCKLAGCNKDLAKCSLDKSNNAKCVCNPGYFGDGKTCQDIDECALPEGRICKGENTYCLNSEGSFSCECIPNYLPEEEDSVVGAYRSCPVFDKCTFGKTCACRHISTLDTVPDFDSLYPGVNLLHREQALAAIDMWSQITIENYFEMAKCNEFALNYLTNNITFYRDHVKGNHEKLIESRDHLRRLIDCNENKALETAYFHLYDEVCEQSIALLQVLKDLNMKLVLVKNEMKRCEGSTWDVMVDGG